MPVRLRALSNHAYRLKASLSFARPSGRQAQD